MGRTGSTRRSCGPWASVPLCSAREPDRHALEAVVEIGAGLHRIAGELDRAERREQLLEEDLRLEPRQVGSEAEVGADPEAEMRVRRAVDVERLGVGEHVLVAV